jgi:predicted transcriptional regulator of viral defense system
VTTQPPPPLARAFAVLKQSGIARSRELERAGLSRTEIRRLVARGVLERVGRGLYRAAEAPLEAGCDLAEAARLVPDAVVCLLSALRFHQLTTQNPVEVWLAIDRKAWRPTVDRPPMRFVYLSGSSLHEGVEEHEIAGVPVRVYGAAKTVADCFKFRNKIGVDVAVEALREYRRAYPKRLGELVRFAEVNRVTRVMQPYLEATG